MSEVARPFLVPRPGVEALALMPLQAIAENQFGFSAATLSAYAKEQAERTAKWLDGLAGQLTRVEAERDLAVAIPRVEPHELLEIRTPVGFAYVCNVPEGLSAPTVDEAGAGLIVAAKSTGELDGVQQDG